MTREQLSTALRNAADAIDALPEFAQPFGAMFGYGGTRIQLTFEDFARLHCHAVSEYDGTCMRLSSVDSRGVEWHASHRPTSKKGEWSRPGGAIAGDGGDDELALAPAAHAACEVSP